MCLIFRERFYHVEDLCPCVLIYLLVDIVDCVVGNIFSEQGEVFFFFWLKIEKQKLCD